MFHHPSDRVASHEATRVLPARHRYRLHLLLGGKPVLADCLAMGGGRRGLLCRLRWTRGRGKILFIAVASRRRMSFGFWRCRPGRGAIPGNGAGIWGVGRTRARVIGGRRIRRFSAGVIGSLRVWREVHICRAHAQPCHKCGNGQNVRVCPAWMPMC